jgi:murein DD-endopeptidase MepM/ murein hydrolase activator NlpD
MISISKKVAKAVAKKIGEKKQTTTSPQSTEGKNQAGYAQALGAPATSPTTSTDPTAQPAAPKPTMPFGMAEAWGLLVPQAVKALGNSAKNGKPQMDLDKANTDLSRELDLRKDKADKDIDDVNKKTAEERKKADKHKRNSDSEIWIGAGLAGLAAALGAKDMPETYANFLGMSRDRRAGEAQDRIASAQDDANAQIKSIQDAFNLDARGVKYKVEDNNTKIGRYNKLGEVFGQFEQDKKKEKEVNIENTLRRFADGVKYLEGDEKALAYIASEEKFRKDNGLPPMDEPTKFIYRETAIKNAQMDAQDRRMFDADWREFVKLREKFWVDGAKDEEFYQYIEGVRLQLYAKYGLEALNVPTSRTPDAKFFKQEHDKLSKDKRDTQYTKESEARIKSINARTASAEALTRQRNGTIKAAADNIKKNGGTPVDSMIIKSANGEAVTPEDLARVSKHLMKTFNAGMNSKAENKTKEGQSGGLVMAIGAFHKAVEILGVQDPLVKQMYTALKVPGYLPKDVQNMEYEEFVTAYNTLKAHAARISSPKKKDNEVSGSSDLRLPFNVKSSSGYGTRTHPVTGEKDKMHYGVDLPQKGGTKVKSAGIGVVTQVAYDKNGYGYWVEIKHPDGRRTRYGHLKSKSPLKVGQKVDGSTVVGLVGATGRTTGNHLHFEVRDSKGRALDPMTQVKR